MPSVAGGGGGLGSKIKYAVKFFTAWVRCLKFVMLHCLIMLYQVCSNEGPRVQAGSGPGDPRFNHRNTQKNIQKCSSSEPLGSDA